MNATKNIVQSFTDSCRKVVAKTKQIFRVPSLVTGAASTGRQSNALVEAVDVFPTLVDLCGLPAIDVCPELTSRDIITCTEGASMVPLLSTGKLG